MTHTFSLDEYYEVEAVSALVAVRAEFADPRVFDLVWCVVSPTDTVRGESGPHIDAELKLSHEQWLPPTGRLATNPPHPPRE